LIKRLINLEKFDLYVDASDTHVSSKLIKYKKYEPIVLGVMETFLKPGMTFVDLGAHVGYFTLHGAFLVGLTGFVYAAEPDPSNFSLLQDNVELNKSKMGNVKALNIAISKYDGKGVLYLNSSNKGDHRIFSNPQAGLDTVAIDVKRFDTVFPIDYDFVKIDVQGAEPMVFSGMESFKSTKKRVVLFEFWAKGIMQAGTDLRKFYERLASMGNLYLVNAPGVNRFEPLTYDLYLTISNNTMNMSNRQFLLTNYKLDKGE